MPAARMQSNGFMVLKIMSAPEKDFFESAEEKALIRKNDII
jgi:hypothetical protein